MPYIGPWPGTLLIQQSRLCWYCAALCTRHTKTALCWCNKRQQRTSNTSVEGTPPLDTRGKIPLSVRVCICELLLTMHQFVWNFIANTLPVILCSVSLRGPHRGVCCVLWIISWWRPWSAVEQHKLCPTSAVQLWPFLRQRIDTLDPELFQSQGCLEGVQSV